MDDLFSSAGSAFSFQLAPSVSRKFVCNKVARERSHSLNNDVRLCVPRGAVGAPWTEMCCLSSRFYFSVNKKKNKDSSGRGGGAAFKRKKCKMHFSQLLWGRLLIIKDLRGFFYFALILLFMLTRLYQSKMADSLDSWDGLAGPPVGWNSGKCNLYSWLSADNEVNI